MGLTISLQNENGEAKTRVFDPRDLLHRQLTMTSEGILGGIDWYGDTTFNTLQMRQFIPEWQALIERASDPNEFALLTEILALAQVCLKEVHLYQKFEGDSMLSRVADSLYWMSRSLERAEHTTRLLEVNLNLMLDESAANAERRWQRVLLALGQPKDIAWGGDPYALVRTLTFDTEYKGSILACIISARENARHVREQISTEQWDRLNRLFLQVTRPSLEADMLAEAQMTGNDQPTEFLAQVMEAVHQFQGVTDSTMSHGEGWQFIQVGRYIERASATAMLLEAYHEEFWSNPDRIPEANEYLSWMGLLRSATAFEAYCKVYTADLTPEQILEFLLLDPEFPHSIRFSIDGLQNALEAIHGEAGKSRAEPLRRLAGRLQASLSYSSVDDILNEDVIAYLRKIQHQCKEIHDTIYELYVDYAIQTALAG